MACSGIRIAGAIVALTAGLHPEVQAAPATPIHALSAHPIAPMSAPRASHSATLLADGSVLIAGGCVTDGCDAKTTTTERYDPRRAAFVPSGSMTDRRSSHAAVRLADGRVLITGGWTHNGVTATAEVYDPANSRFSPAGAMVAPRSDHATVTLPDGRVLLIGGERATQIALASVEAYDPRDGRFREVGALTVPRLSHAAKLLPDGRVLVVGGRSGRGQVLASAEIFDPANGRSTPTGSMRAPRHKFGATALLDGRLIVVGGSDSDASGARYTSSEIYDPARGTFVAGPELGRPRYKLRGGVVTLASGAVLVAGGAELAEVLDVAAGRARDVPGATTGAHAFSSATLLDDGRVLLAGGYDARLRVTRGAWLIGPD